MIKKKWQPRTGVVRVNGKAVQVVERVQPLASSKYVQVALIGRGRAGYERHKLLSLSEVDFQER
jgi:hypothetical protein